MKSLKVKLNGDETVMNALVRCEYVESYDKLDALVLTVTVHQHSDDTLASTIVAGMPYELTLEEDGTVVTTAKGDIVEVRHVRRGGRHRVTAIGLDQLHRLDGAHAQAQVWEVAHDQIVTDIASRNSLTGTAEGVDGIAAQLLQNTGSDASFLKKLARENNYFVRVDDTTLTFGRKAAEGTAIAVDFATESDLEIEQTTDLTGIATKVTVHGSDYLQDAVFTGEATSADLKGITGGRTGVAVVQDLIGEVAVILNQSGYSDASRATARAKAELQERAEKFLRGSVWASGRPDALSGKPLTITGAGWPLDGTFLIRQTTHVLDHRGYRTRIDFVSDSLPAAT